MLMLNFKLGWLFMLISFMLNELGWLSQMNGCMHCLIAYWNTFLTLT